MDSRMKEALDRYITGNYGEDQFEYQRCDTCDQLLGIDSFQEDPQRNMCNYCYYGYLIDKEESNG